MNNILKHKTKITCQTCESNKTSVDKIKELRQVADMAFKSKKQTTAMPSR